MPGYSGTPLPAKLGIRAGSAVHVKDAPPDYLNLLDPLPEGVTFVSRISRATDLVHIFSVNRAQLANWLRTCRSKLRPTAVLMDLLAQEVCQDANRYYGRHHPRTGVATRVR